MAPVSGATPASLRGAAGQLYLAEFGSPGWPETAEDELYTLPVWGAHRLSADRKSTWSLHVTRDWRLTLRIDRNHIVDVDFEDYH